jgi:hypothetical protein
MERFQYHALAVGASGRIERPFDEIIPAKASLALPETGGFGSVRVEHYRFREILSFDAAYAVVAGSFSERNGGSHDALATVVIEGLDVLGAVTADRIVARIASSHPLDPKKERSITALGSYFENLRIGGILVNPELAQDTFARFDNADKVRNAYLNNEDKFRQEFNGLTLAGEAERVPEHLHKYFPWLNTDPTEQIKAMRGVITCPLVRHLGCSGAGLKCYGHIVVFEGFGIIRLAELKLTQTSLQIAMVQIDLGSTPRGCIAIGGSQGNGSPW